MEGMLGAAVMVMVWTAGKAVEGIGYSAVRRRARRVAGNWRGCCILMICIIPDVITEDIFDLDIVSSGYIETTYQLPDALQSGVVDSYQR